MWRRVPPSWLSTWRPRRCWQRFALGTRRVTHRDLAWAEHARCHQRVGAVLPVLAGAALLTRVLVNEMITLYYRLDDSPPAAEISRAQRRT